MSRILFFLFFRDEKNCIEAAWKVDKEKQITHLLSQQIKMQLKQSMPNQKQEKSKSYDDKWAPVDLGLASFGGLFRACCGVNERLTQHLLKVHEWGCPE